jgi:hypothetical protein
MKFNHNVAGTENPMKLRQKRRDIARMKTILERKKKQRQIIFTMERNLRKERTGVVTSNKMEKSIVVTVETKIHAPEIW